MRRPRASPTCGPRFSRRSACATASRPTRRARSSSTAACRGSSRRSRRCSTRATRSSCSRRTGRRSWISIAYHEAKAVLVPTDAGAPRGPHAGAGAKDDGAHEAALLELPQQPDRRRLRAPAKSKRSRPSRASAGLAVISDEAYEDLVYEGEPPVAIASLPGMYERTLTVYTLSKSYSMTGWRIGYVIAPKAYQTAIKTVVLYTTNGVSTPTQWAALEAIRRGTEFVAEWKYRLPRAARPTGRRPARGGVRAGGPARRALPFSEDSRLAGQRLARGRAHAPGRRARRDGAGSRLRPRGRGPPALLVLGLGRDDRRRRRGARDLRPRDAPPPGASDASVRRALASAVVALAFARTPLFADQFDDALAQAQAKLATPEGQAYALSVAARFDEKKLRDALMECAETLPPEHNPPFTVLLELTADGRATEVLLRPPAPVAVCLRWVIRESAFPRPPAPGYWVERRSQREPRRGRAASPRRPASRPPRFRRLRRLAPPPRAATPVAVPSPTPAPPLPGVFSAEGIHVDSRQADLAALRRSLAASSTAGIGPLLAQSDGVAPDDARLEPYWSLAEELDRPIAIALGPAAPGDSSPSYRVALGDPREARNRSGPPSPASPRRLRRRLAVRRCDGRA